MFPTMLLLSLLSAALACDSADEYARNLANLDGSTPFHKGLGGMPESEASLGSAPLTLLPQDKGDESPACLDGSPYGFYFNPSTTGSTKWTISIEGGGWCYDEDSCYSRSKMNLGSSKAWAKTAGCGCMNVEGDNLDRDCNCLYMPYGDGASFSGFRTKPWPVPGKPGETLTFRGIKNFDATIAWALKHGLGNATDFVLTGGSAGGLSTFLHMDRAGEAIHKVNPKAVVKGAPVVGFFLDHANIKHDAANYTAWMKYIYGMQNLTFGADGGLTAACQAANPTNPHYCFMSPHMQSFVKTPFFVFNSKFDAWQLSNELHSYQTDAVVQYGKDFMAQFQPMYSEPKNGAFITTCVCHGCPWGDLTLNNESSYNHYAAWHSGVTTGTASLHVDARGPNGDGTLKGGKFSGCKALTP